MPRALAVPVRQVLLRRWQRGQTAAEIAAALDLAPRTVRHLIHRFRQGQADVNHADADALPPAYGRCGWRRSWCNQLLWQNALDLRRQHASWGAGLIRVFLKERWRKQRLPSERTLQRWFHRAGLGPAPRGRRPRASRTRAGRPHEVWEMDAVEQIRLLNGQRACWLRLTDEFTGAVLYTKVFHGGRWSLVGAAAVQAELRKAFMRWGRPQRLRVDNGAPWGSTGGLPTPLALWILGLQVEVTWNRPRRPKENAVVERTQGVSERWAEPQTCADAQELQQRLDRLDRVQREKYPSIRGRSRVQAYPRLRHAERHYSQAWEAKHWNLQWVLDCLAEYALPRCVDRCGDVWLYDRRHWVGKAALGQEVYVTLDAVTREWIVQDAKGREIRRIPARELTRERIVNLNVGRSRHRSPRGKPERRLKRQNYVSHLAAKQVS